MNERYSRLFLLPNHLYASDAPVLIEAGALLGDKQTGKVLAQLKIQNIGAKQIKAVFVSIQPFDVAGIVLGDQIYHQYLDLKINRNECFGTQVPIVLPDVNTRSFSVGVTRVIFEDNTSWNFNGEPWEPLILPESLEQALNDQELLKQYRIQYGADCQYVPAIRRELWYCTCGVWNREEETNCCRCHRSISEMFSVDMDSLKLERDARLAAEQKIAVEKKTARGARTKKIIKKLLIVMAALLLVAAAIVSFFAIKEYREEMRRQEEYNSAVELYESGAYEEAIDAFQMLGDYKDSRSKLRKAKKALEQKILEEKYSHAVALFEAEQYDKALAAFEEISDYSDSKSYINTCKKRIEEIQVRNNFAGTWRWTTGGKTSSLNTIFYREYNPFDVLYVDFENMTITLKFSGTKSFEKTNEFKIISPTVLETYGFRYPMKMYWILKDGVVIVSLTKDGSGTSWMPVCRIGE